MDGRTQETSVLSLYGALDLLASDGEISRDDLAFWVPHYANGLEPGWFADFAVRVGIEISEPRDDIDRALEELVETGDQTRGVGEDERSMAHRFHALTLVSRLLPERYGPNGEQANSMREALQPIVEFTPFGTRDVDEDALAQLHSLIHETSEIHHSDGRSAFAAITEAAVANDLITNFILNHQNVMCDGKTVPQKSILGKVVQAAVLDTEFCASDLSFKGLIDTLLNPASWDECFAGFWCEMNPLDGDNGPISVGDTREYDEVVGSCGNPDAWEIRTCLEFKRLKTNDENVAVIQYRLCKEGQPKPPMVTVDAGFIQVENKSDGRVCVTTQKVVAFDGIPSLGIALFACVTGWSHGAVDIAYSCGGRKTPEDPDEGRSDAGFDQIADDALRYCDEWLTDCLAQWKVTASQLADGTYSSKQMSSDAMSYMTRMARDYSRLASLGLRTMAAAAATSATPVRPATTRISPDLAQQPSASKGAEAKAPEPATVKASPEKSEHKSNKKKNKGSSKEGKS